MRRDGSQIITVGAVIFSIALHVVVLSPGLVSVLLSPGPDLRHLRSHPNDDSRDWLEPEVEKLQLGIEQSTARTVTWIGYRQYEEHIAELREFEQAAFTVQPTRPTRPAPFEVPIPAATAQKRQAVFGAPESRLEPARRFELPVFRAGREVAPQISDLDGDESSSTRAQVEAADANSEAVKTANADADAPAAPETPVEVDVAVPPAEAIPSEPRTGDVAEKESDPTSIIKAMPEHWRTGKPLAAHGLELLPKRPEFTVLQRLTTSPGNPLVEFGFNGQGVPVEANIVEHSGDTRVDSTILASLFRWRAKGEQLAELEQDELLRVQIRIVLNPRAPH